MILTKSHPAIGGLRFALGGNVFGWTADRDTSFAILDCFYERGGRMVDTAEAYANTESEKIIGAWMADRGVRKHMLIGTKTGVMGKPGMLKPETLAAALEASLDRLQTDYVDIYYAHRDEPQTPQAEVAAGFDALVKAGKVREAGASGFTFDRLQGALSAARDNGLTPYTVFQPGFNLVSRSDFPRALQALCVENEIAVFPYFGLASGYLTGKYRTPEDFERAGNRGKWAKAYAQDDGRALAALDQIAAETGATQGQIALAWLAAQPSIAAPLASGKKVAQVEELCAFTSLKLTANQLTRLDAAAPNA
jgi:aryl-alcohol dehydrogenase-like predicted oxidoreductase